MRTEEKLKLFSTAYRKHLVSKAKNDPFNAAYKSKPVPGDFDLIAQFDLSAAELVVRQLYREFGIKEE